ncbi:hypothetical protein BC827DRAFT_954965 [Russula dissimulans]|nr:hypothetical protein BC827DRAFT_954965 [Russula dissimulans]
MKANPTAFLSLLWGNQMYSTIASPVPGNLCQVQTIVADIYRTVERSRVPDQVKENLKQCTRQLEDECSKSTKLTQLVHRAANDSRNVLLSRIRFLDSLEGRINELSQLRAKFIDSRRAFREQPNRLLTELIREARHQVHDGMLSKLRPLFKDIRRYYNEINVSLYTEEECLKKIRRSFRFTPDDRHRWEYIRDECRKASYLFTGAISNRFSRVPSRSSYHATRRHHPHLPHLPTRPSQLATMPLVTSSTSRKQS